MHIGHYDRAFPGPDQPPAPGRDHPQPVRPGPPHRARAPADHRRAGRRGALGRVHGVAGPGRVCRVWPAAVFLADSAIGFAQWLLGFPLLGDIALLVALYTVAAHQARTRALLAAAVLEAGAVMAAAKWEPAGT